MARNRIVILYDNGEPGSVQADGVELKQFVLLRQKKIEDWFLPSKGRDGWNGFMEEIRDAVGDNTAELFFEFSGPEEAKQRFETTAAQYGYADCLRQYSDEDVIAQNLDNAARIFDSDPEKAFSYYKEAAERGSAEGAYQTGFSYETGHGAVRDAALAVQWYKKAEEKNHAYAAFRLGKCYYYGEGVAADDTAAFRYLTGAVKLGCVEANGLLGDCFRLGRGTQEDIARAIGCYREVQNTDPAAKRILAECMLYGRGVQPDEKSALSLLDAAAREGDLQAKLLKSECLAQGVGCEPAPEEALETLRDADDNDARVLWQKGVLAHAGAETEEERSQAQALIEQAAEKGDARAQYALAVAALTASQSTEDEDEEISSAAELSFKTDDYGSLNTAVLRARRIPLLKFLRDPESARNAAKAAAAGDLPPAITELIKPLLPDDPFEAFLLQEQTETGYRMVLSSAGDPLTTITELMKSLKPDDSIKASLLPRATLGISTTAASLPFATSIFGGTAASLSFAALNIGNLTKRGGEVPEIASELFSFQRSNALHAPHTLALHTIRSLYERGGEVPASVFERFLAAAKQGCLPAQFAAGVCLTYGLGTEKNADEGMRLLLKAGQKGHAEAMSLYGRAMEEANEPALAAATDLIAAACGDESAAFRTGKRFLEGSFVPKDAALGVKWLDDAFACGYADAACELCRCCNEGIGTPTDPYAAEQLLLFAMEHAGTSQKAEIGLYWNRFFAVGNDDRYRNETVSGYIDSLAENGSAEAMYQKALCLLNGRGVKEDSDEGTFWLIKAVLNGHAQAAVVLAAVLPPSEDEPRDLPVTGSQFLQWQKLLLYRYMYEIHTLGKDPFRFDQYVPDDRIRSICEGMLIPPKKLAEETPIVFFDTALIHKAKNGLLFSDKSLYWREVLEKKCVSIRYDSIVGVTVIAPNKKKQQDCDSTLRIVYKEIAGDGTAHKYRTEISTTYFNKTPLRDVLIEMTDGIKKRNALIPGSCDEN